MVNITRGKIENKPITEDFVSFFEKNEYIEGNLFLGYPILPSSDNKIHIDALLISKEYGILAFIFNNDTNIKTDHNEDNQDNIYNLLLSKLAKETSLIKRGTLKIYLDVVTFAPNTITNIEEKIISNHSDLKDYFSTINKDNSSYYEYAMRSIQSIGTMKKVLSREKAITKNSRGWKLKNLEKAVANLDKTQMSAALEISDNVQRIRGLAGSGKTIVLALKAAYMHVSNPTWKIAVTFNTRSLKQQFKELITRFVYEQSESVPNWDNLNIIHAWGSPNEEGIYYNFCRTHNIEYMDFKNAKAHSSFDTAFDFACREAMSKCSHAQKMYDVILVDEAQDFSYDFLNMCYEILPADKRLVYAYDELQSLSAKSVKSPEEIFGNNTLGLPRVTLKNECNKPREDIILNVCYRNSRPVLASAHALGFRIYGDLIQMFDDSSLWLDIGYEVVNGQLKDDNPVTLKRSKDCSPEFLENHSSIDDLIQFINFNSELEQAEWIGNQIYKNLNEDELEYRDILVIHTDPLHTRDKVGLLRKVLINKGINSHLAGVTTSPDEFFQDNSITFTSIYRAKGNEAAMVYVIDGQNCGSNSATLKSRNILFTAMTRSKAWVRVTGYGNNMEELCNEYQKIKDNNFMLEFTYPNKELRNKLNIINRDKSLAQEKKIQTINNNVDDMLDAFTNGELFIEDIPKEKLQRLRGLIGNE